MADDTAPRDGQTERPRGRGEIVIRMTNRAIFVVLGALGFLWLIAHATHIFVVLLIAVLLASSVSLAANRLERVHIKRSLAILLVYIVVLAVVAGSSRSSSH